MGGIDFMKELDEAVWAVLPPNSTLERITRSGETNWSTGLKVDILVTTTTPSSSSSSSVPSSTPQSYFLKVATHPEGIVMCKSEYLCQETLHAAIPQNASAPLAWGVFSSNPSIAFYITKFRTLRPTSITPERLAKILHRLHTSTARPLGSPYGFDAVTVKGFAPLVVDWKESWTEVFVPQWYYAIAGAVGEWPHTPRPHDAELKELGYRVGREVIPRLLGAMGGDLARPVLCHGDLWHGNAELDEETGEIVIFDPACLYAPGEYELAHFVAPRYEFKQPHMDAYVSAMGGVAEPCDEFPDRVRLYHLRNQFLVLAAWDKEQHIRESVKDELRELLAKYGTGVEGASESAVVEEDAAVDDDVGKVTTGLEKVEPLVLVEAGVA